MTSLRLLVRIWLSASLFVLFASVLDAQTFTTFDVPGSVGTYPMAISPSGEITGYADNQGFIRLPDHTFVTFVIPGGQPDGCGPWVTGNTFPTALNAAGEITGSFFQSTGCDEREGGFIREPGGIITTFFITDYGTFLRPLAINPAGEIAGFYNGEEGDHYAFLRQPNGSTTYLPEAFFFSLNPAGQIAGADISGGFLRAPDGQLTRIDLGRGTTPASIDPKGNITGSYYDVTLASLYGFFWRPDGTTTTFLVPDSAATLPASMNSSDEIAGTYTDQNQLNHGFLRQRNGVIVTFDVPNSVETNPTAINSAGQITGWYSDAEGVHGFIRDRSKANCGITFMRVYSHNELLTKFTAAVEGVPPASAPTGRVRFWDSAYSEVVLGQAQLVNGEASITVLLDPEPNPQWVKAVYEGDGNLNGCESPYLATFQ